MKKILILTLLVLTSTTFFTACKKKVVIEPQEQTQKKKVSKPVNEIPISERPYVVMSPTLNREVNVTIHHVPKVANEVEFLAEYQYGTSLGGNENFIDLSKGLPASKQFALYSRSAGGKTSYEEDVKGGTLTLMFADPEEYWLKQEWNYFDRANTKSTTKTSALKSRDSKFEITSNGLETLKYVIIYNSPGYPEELPGTAQSDLYTFSYAGTTTAKTATVSIAVDSSTATIYGWDGEGWQEFATTISNGKATATVDLVEAYIALE